MVPDDGETNIEKLNSTFYSKCNLQPLEVFAGHCALEFYLNNKLQMQNLEKKCNDH